MSQTLTSDKKIFILSIVAAATTVIAGVLHIQMAPRSLSENVGEGILFLVGGLLQIFWAVPVIKRWGRPWQIIGIAGTAIFFALWYADRLHLIPQGEMSGGAQRTPGEFPRGNMTQGEFPRGNLPRGEGGFRVPQLEYFQIAFIGLYLALGIMMSRKKKESKRV
ncbi:MAG TPA: hypothetical protein VLT63_00010 [Candidatus Acidoferrum sp.]|nr:hypothetical protein [Candidatus Acidoferrum sp.]